MGRYIVGPDILPSLTPSGRNPLRYNSTGAGLLERAAGIEPASSAWKAEVIAIIRCPPALLIMTTRKKWWREKDSNLRRQSRQIYSLIPLAARESLQITVRLSIGEPYPSAGILWDRKPLRQQQICCFFS